MTVTATKDADGVDDVVNIVHTAASTDAAYNAITAKVAATETDNNNAPISRDFRHSVKKKTAAASTKVAVRDFQYHDADGDKMKSVIIVSLPDSADGVLKLKKTSDSTETNVAAGQTVPNDEGANSATQQIMYFHPTDAFNIDWDEVTFTYKVVDDADNVSDAAYTATLFVERADAPSALSGFAASPGKNKARLTWNNPNDSSIGLYEYQYRKKEVRGIWTFWAPASSSPITRFDVFGLTNGEEYEFQVRYDNPKGTSPVATASAIPNALPAPVMTAAGGANRIDLSWPAAANALVASYEVRRREGGLAAFPGNAQVTLLWDDPNDSTITGWEFRHKFGGNDYPGWRIMLGSGAATTTHVVRQLTNDTAYTFQVRPVRGLAKGAALGESTATPKATATGDGWKAITNAKATSYAATGLTVGKFYAFQLRAWENSAWGPAAGVSTAWLRSSPLPAKPTGLTAIPGDTNVTLSWTNPANPTIDEWEYSTNDGTSWNDIADSDANTTSATVGSLVNGTRYNFKVRAANVGGDSPASDRVAKAPNAAPAAPAGFDGGGESRQRRSELDQPQRQSHNRLPIPSSRRIRAA